MTPERLMSLAAAKGLSFDWIPGGGRPEYTAADAALALAGLPREQRTACYAAFAYRWAGDDSQRSTLHGCLMNASILMAEREHWPTRIREQRYLQRLVHLAILEERFWWLINFHRLWPAIMADDGFQNMDEELWRRRMSRKYEAVRDIIQTWCSVTRYHAQARIEGHGGT